MIEGIINVPNQRTIAVDNLKLSKLPVVVYGAGSYAEDTFHFLTRHGVTIDVFCVDEKYLNDANLFMDKFPLIAIEKLHEKYPECELVIGFADYEKAKDTLRHLGFNQKAYFIDAPDQDDSLDYNYVENNIEKFSETYEMLADERSRDIFKSFINAKISGDPSGLYDYTEFNQYFPDLLTFSDTEVFVDCGAYDGDTILDFIGKVKNRSYQKIFAFEPDGTNYSKLLETIEKKLIKNIEPINTGTWSEKTTLHFADSGTVRSNVIDNGTVKIDVDTIDTVVKDAPVSFIKMDIEGSELESLHGAQKTISTNKPKLAICVYHKQEDLITIPQYIKGLVGNYKIYLRQHQFVSWDMVLYAVPTLNQ